MILVIGYLGPGVLFALWFFTRGHAVIDPSSAGAAWSTRLLWLPAAALLWPLLIGRARRTAPGEPQETAQ